MKEYYDCFDKEGKLKYPLTEFGYCLNCKHALLSHNKVKCNNPLRKKSVIILNDNNKLSVQDIPRENWYDGSKLNIYNHCSLFEGDFDE